MALPHAYHAHTTIVGKLPNPNKDSAQQQHRNMHSQCDSNNAGNDTT
jgi:hypothetical protein